MMILRLKRLAACDITYLMILRTRMELWLLRKVLYTRLVKGKWTHTGSIPKPGHGQRPYYVGVVQSTHSLRIGQIV